MRKFVAVRKALGILGASAFAFATAAHAAPVARTADLRLTLTIQNLPGISVSVTGATVVVDSAAAGPLGAGQIAIAAGAITLATPLSIPVTATTALAALTAKTISNLAGTFSFGGAAVGVPGTETPCPPAGAGIACANQTGLGGVMGLAGTINVVIVPGLLTIPVQLNVAGIGQGGNVTVGGFTFDAAPWTLEKASVAYTATSTYMTPFMAGSVTITNSWTSTVTQMGTVSGPGAKMTLVSPTFVSALGNLLPQFGELEIAFTDGGGLPGFVPEPGALLMLGAGGALFALLGRRRR